MNDHMTLSTHWLRSEGVRWSQWTAEQNNPALAVIVRRHADIQADRERFLAERDARAGQMKTEIR